MVSTDLEANVCEAVDVPMIRFLAKFPISQPTSKHVLHLHRDALARDDILDLVGNTLATNMPVVIRADGHYNADDSLSADYLDKRFAISPNRPACIHGASIILA